MYRICDSVDLEGGSSNQCNQLLASCHQRPLYMSVILMSGENVTSPKHVKGYLASVVKMVWVLFDIPHYCMPPLTNLFQMKFATKCNGSKSFFTLKNNDGVGSNLCQGTCIYVVISAAWRSCMETLSSARKLLYEHRSMGFC